MLIGIIFHHIILNYEIPQGKLGKIIYLMIASGGVGVAVFFFLSGYGNYFSMRKAKKLVPLCSCKIIRSIISFILCFFVVVITAKVFYGTPIENMLSDVVTLTIPNTSSWYLKVQILMYIILMVSCIAFSKNQLSRAICITSVSFVYGIWAYAFKLPTYWWDTALCFSVGYWCGYLSENGHFKVKSPKYIVILLLFICMVIAFIYTQKSAWFGIKLIANIVLPFCIVCILDMVSFRLRVLELIAPYSLESYLIHIGLVAVLYKNFTVYGGVIFIICTIVFSFVCKRIGEFIMKRLWKISP